MTRVQERLGKDAATFLDNTQITEPVDILGSWRPAPLPKMNDELPHYMRPTASTLARSGGDWSDKFVFSAEIGEGGCRSGPNRAPALRNRRASIGGGGGFGDGSGVVKSGVRVHTPVPEKFATGQRAKSMDNESSLGGSFLDSVLVEIQRQSKLARLEPGNLSPMRVKTNGVGLSSIELEESHSDQPSCQTPEILPANVHHERLDELIARCANLTCQDGPNQISEDSNDFGLPASPSSSEASVTSRLKHKEALIEGRLDLESDKDEMGGLENCDEMVCVDFTGSPEVITGTQ